MREKIKIGLTAEQWQDIADALELARRPLDQHWCWGDIADRENKEVEFVRDAVQSTLDNFAQLKKKLIQKATKKGLELDGNVRLRR